MHQVQLALQDGSRNHGFEEIVNWSRYKQILGCTSMLVPPLRHWVYSSVSDSLDKVVAANPDSQISVIAHSFGTLATFVALCNHRAIRLENLIFIGSVVPVTPDTEADWKNISDRVANAFVNDVGCKDTVVLLAPWGSPGLGDSGRFGVPFSCVHNRYHKTNTHTNWSRDPSFAHRYWVPLLRGENFDQLQKRLSSEIVAGDPHQLSNPPNAPFCYASFNEVFRWCTPGLWIFLIGVWAALYFLPRGVMNSSQAIGNYIEHIRARTSYTLQAKGASADQPPQSNDPLRLAEYAWNHAMIQDALQTSREEKAARIAADSQVLVLDANESFDCSWAKFEGVLKSNVKLNSEVEWSGNACLLRIIDNRVTPLPLVTEPTEQGLKIIARDVAKDDLLRVFLKLSVRSGEVVKGSNPLNLPQGWVFTFSKDGGNHVQ